MKKTKYCLLDQNGALVTYGKRNTLIAMALTNPCLQFAATVPLRRKKGGTYAS